jgi:hypothetical protein
MRAVKNLKQAVASQATELAPGAGSGHQWSTLPADLLRLTYDE